MDDFLGQGDGDLSPEQAAAILDAAMQGESSDLDLSVDEAQGEPNETAQPETDNVGNQAADEPSETPNYADEVAALRTELDALKAAQNTPAEKPNGVEALPENVQALAEQSGLSDDEIEKLFGDFSEKDIAKAVDKLIDLKLENKVLKSVDERVQAALSPIQQKEQEAVAQAHYQQIMAAHPDAGEIVQGKALGDWVASLPSYARGGVQAILEKGSASEVIEVLNDFKAANGVKNAPDVAKKRADDNVPDTLSGIPSGRTGGVSQQDALNALSSEQLVDKLGEMSPEQVEKFLNSID